MKEGIVLVTGASGFIGRNVVRELSRSGRPIRLLDLDLSGFDAMDCELFEGSVADPDLVHKAMAGTEGVVHLAHLIDIEGAQPFKCNSVNVVGTSNVFQSALEAGTRRVVWGSSVMIYGSAKTNGAVREDYQQAPDTFYGAGKLYLEFLGRAYRAVGLETVGLRMTTVFGPERTRGGAAPFVVDLLREPAAGRPISVLEGDRRLDIIYGQDAARGCVLALDAPHSLGLAYNVGGFSTRVRDIADAVRKHFPNSEIHVADGGSNPWPEELDCSAARHDFGYEPRFDLERSVAHYLAALSSVF